MPKRKFIIFYYKIYSLNINFLLFSGENVEEAFLKTAGMIFQRVQEGRFEHLKKKYSNSG